MDTAPLQHPGDIDLLCAILRAHGTAPSPGLEWPVSHRQWERLSALAWWHRVGPTFHIQLAHLSPGLVPPEFVESSYQLFAANARSNLLRSAVLKDLLATLADGGVTAVPFKGPLLAYIAYGDVALRQFGDLDLLVARRDVQRAEQLLFAKGFGSHETARLTSALSWPAVYHRVWERGRDGSAVEIHWRVAARARCFDLATSTLLASAQRTSFLDTELPAFSPEHTILVLCAHGSRHGWDRLGMLLDIDQFVRSAHVDWSLACSLADQLGARRMLGFALQASNELFGTPLPDADWERTLGDPSLPRLTREHGRRLRSVLVARDGSQPAPHRMFYLKLRERWRDRLGYLWFSLTSPTAREPEIVSLPVGLQSMYYPLRVFDLIARYGVRIPIARGRTRAKSSVKTLVLPTRRTAKAFGRLESSARREVLEAVAFSAGVRLGLWVLPFGLLQRLISGVATKGSQAAGEERVRDAIRRASPVVPRSTCLTRALAAQLMLKRRGYSPILRIGVARGDGVPLEAHAWVEDHGKILVGGEGHQRFTVLPELSERRHSR